MHSSKRDMLSARNTSLYVYGTYHTHMVHTIRIWSYRMQPSYIAIVIRIFKILQEYGIEKSQFTSIISVPPPLVELSKGKYMQ